MYLIDHDNPNQKDLDIFLEFLSKYNELKMFPIEHLDNDNSKNDHKKKLMDLKDDVNQNNKLLQNYTELLRSNIDSLLFKIDMIHQLIPSKSKMNGGKYNKTIRKNKK